MALLILATGLLTNCGGGTGAGSVGSEGFGKTGKVHTDFGGEDVANALAIQRDGRIVAAGRKGRAFALARYTRDGQLDPSFGNGGKVVTDFGAPAGKYAALVDKHGAAAVAIQGDGKIVAAGGRGSDFALARYEPDGQLDPTFGSGGKVVTDVGARPGRWDAYWLRGANAIAIQPDGKIIAAGAGPGDFALVRYTRDGRLDRGFGGDGKVLTDVVRGHAEAIALQADGKVIAGGTAGNAPALAGYLPGGRLNPAFGKGGRVVGNGADDYNSFDALAVQPDGKIVAAGSAGPRFPAILLARYTATGRLDPSFGSAGPARGPADGASAVAMLSDGRIVVAGVSSQLTDPTNGRFAYYLALIRYRRDGHLDPTFGNRGSVLTRLGRGFFGRSGSSDTPLLVTAVAIQAGKIVVAGSSGRNLRSRDFLLVRYRPDGTVARAQ